MIVETPGGVKPYRRIDASFVDPVTGEYFHFNVGLKYKNVFKSGPIQRELDALDDVKMFAQKKHRNIEFIDYTP